MILKFGKKNNEEDYQLAKCTFKPKTNKIFNLQNTSRFGISVRSNIKRPGSQAQPSSNKNLQSNIYTKN